MDDSAIKRIQQTAIEADAIRQSSANNSNLLVLPDDHEIHDLEQYQPGRRRFRGALQTDSLADFVGYVKRRHQADAIAGDGIPGFIAAENLAATVLFNLGTLEAPGHADDKATLKLKATAPYTALLQANGRQLAHKDAVNWLEDWAENLDYRDHTGEEIRPSTALAAIRKITIRATAESTSSQEEFRATRTALEDVEARGATALPSELRFTCTPYPGLPARVFRLRLGVLTTTDKPVLVLRVRNLEAEQEAIAQDFKSALLTELDGIAALTIGTFTP